RVARIQSHGRGVIPERRSIVGTLGINVRPIEVGRGKVRRFTDALVDIGRAPAELPAKVTYLVAVIRGASGSQRCSQQGRSKDDNDPHDLYPRTPLFIDIGLPSGKAKGNEG